MTIPQWCKLILERRFKVVARAKRPGFILGFLIFAALPSLFAGNVTGKVNSPNTGVPLANGQFTFTLTQAAIQVGNFAVAPIAVNCWTDSSGNVVGLPGNAAVALPVLSSNLASGTLPNATYFVKYTWFNSTGESEPSSESSLLLGGAGTLILAAPTTVPANATRLNVYISTSTGTETLQGFVAVTNGVLAGPYSQSVPLVGGAALPSSNTSVCQPLFNDTLIPYPTGYNVNLITQAGSQISGYPQKWLLSGGTINVSTGTPLFSGIVQFPQAIVTSPSSNGLQSINGPLTLNGFGLTAGAGTFSGNETVAGTLGVTGALTVTSINAIQTINSFTSDPGTMIAAAAAALPANGGKILLPNTNGCVNMAVAVVFNKPVFLQGWGQGGNQGSLAVQEQPVTCLTWNGTAGATMLSWVATVNGPLDGGGLDGVKLDGGALAAIDILISSTQKQHFTNFYTTGATAAAFKTDTVTGIAGFQSVRGITIDNWDCREVDSGQTSAHCLWRFSSNPLTGDADFWSVRNITPNFKNGDGVHDTDGESSVFEDVHCFMAAGGTGSCAHETQNTGHIVTANRFIGIDPSTSTIVQDGTSSGGYNEYYVSTANGSSCPTITSGKAFFLCGGLNGTQGSGQMQLGFARADDGSVTNDAYSFTSETSTGMYRAGAQDLSFSVLGAQRLHIVGNSGSPVTLAVPGSPDTTTLNAMAQTLTNKTLNAPLTSGTGLQIFNTTTTCTTGAAVGSTCTTAAISLPVAEADTSYRVGCTGKGPTAVPTVINTANSSATQFTITIAALTAVAASFSSYDCWAGHN